MALLRAKVVQVGFRFGSGLARLGAKAVQIGFRFGSGLVQVWLGFGQRRFRLGSGSVQVWLGFGPRRFRLGSGSGSVQIGHVFGPLCGVGWRHVWPDGSELGFGFCLWLVRTWFRSTSDLFQAGFRFHSEWAQVLNLAHSGAESLTTRNLSPSVIGKVRPSMHACMITHAATHIHGHMPKCRLRTHLHRSTHTNTFARVVVTVVAC